MPGIDDANLLPIDSSSPEVSPPDLVFNYSVTIFTEIKLFRASSKSGNAKKLASIQFYYDSDVLDFGFGIFDYTFATIIKGYTYTYLVCEVEHIIAMVVLYGGP